MSKRSLTVIAAGALGAIGMVAALLSMSAAPGSAVAQTPTKAALQTPAANTAKAIFAGGCFWCVEADFDKVPGVLSTVSGYTGGTVANPSYEQVSGKSTGHAEAVEITYDPSKVSYETLLDTYWHSIDPTVVDRQFCDVGSPYRTGIFAVDAEQEAAAKASKAALDKSKPFKEPIVTKIERAGPFYAAEDYHQDYYRKNPVRYNYYRASCGRDLRLKQLWGSH